MDEQLEFVKMIASRLESAKIPYMITGSMAMTIYSIPRMTRDIDLVVDCRRDDIEQIVDLFAQDCYVDSDSIQDAIDRRSMFNIIHNDWILKADFIVRKDEDYRKVEFERRRRLDIEGEGVWVVALEDLILSKLHWSRASDSELHLGDVRAIIESVPDLDWAYIEGWAEVLSVAEMLKELRRDEGHSPRG